MPRPTTLAVGSLLALALGASTALLAPAATAAAPYTDSYWSASRSLYASGCNTTNSNPISTPPDVAIPADGANHSFDQTYAATITSGSDPTDVSTASFTQHSVGSVGAQGSDPSAISLRYSGTATLTSTKAPSLCKPRGYISTYLRFEFALTKPMWLDVNLSNRGNGYTEVYIYDTVNDPFVDLYGMGLKFDASGRTYLPAGSYRGYLEGDVNIGTPGAPVASSGAMKATFTQPGIRTVGPSGTAKPYVSLPTIRDCATHRLTPTVTTAKKRAKTITKAVISVNGQQVKTVKSPKRGLAIPLTLTDGSAANVKVTVTTAKKIQKKMKNGKKKTVIKKTIRTVSANYLACS